MTTERKALLWAVAVALAALAFGAASFLSPNFGGYKTGQFPVEMSDPPAQPAGYAFAIWGVIYLWLIAGAGFGLLRRATAPDWAPMRPALTLSLGVGATWLAVAAISPLAATVLIWVMLAAALMALFRAPLLDRWWGRAPVGLYAGWLSAASAVSLGIVLAGWGLLSPVGGGMLALGIAVVLAGVVQVALEGVPEYGVAVVWALIALAIGNLGQAGILVALSLLGAVLIGVLALRAALLPRP